jgi:hypothetical protein
MERQSMTTTNELHAIVEGLELVDPGEAASYLGEEEAGVEALAGERVSISFLSPYEDAGVTLLKSKE